MPLKVSDGNGRVPEEYDRPVSGADRTLSKAEAVNWLRRRLQAAEPAAAVRFGDTEARLMTAMPSDDGAMQMWNEMLGREGGLSLLPRELLEVRARVRFAYSQADVLGILPRKQPTGDHRALMESLLEPNTDAHSVGKPAPLIASCMVGYQLLADLPGLLKGVRVSVISCRDVKPVLEERWGLEDVAVYQVPSQYECRDVDGAYEATMHDVPIWPDAHNRVSAKLTVRETGELFLVAAGVFGKDLCIQVREQGGIAVDMGSAIDRLAGKVTRGPVRRMLDFYASGMTVEEIASRLHRLFGIQPPPPEKVAEKIIDVTWKEVANWRSRSVGTTYTSVYVDSFPVVAAGEEHICHLAAGAAKAGPDHLGIWWSKPGDPSGAIKALFPKAKTEPSAKPRASTAAVRKAVDRHGPFTSRQMATILIHLALARARWSSDNV